MGRDVEAEEYERQVVSRHCYSRSEPNPPHDAVLRAHGIGIDAPADSTDSAAELPSRTYLPTDSAERKRTPLCTGLIDYAGAAIDLVAYAGVAARPTEDADSYDLESGVLLALHTRDRDGAPNWSAYQSLCLNALAILHRELTGDPPPTIEGDGWGSLFAAYGLCFAEVARVSWYGNEKHNPGQPLHHAREKSTDHADCVVRHLLDNVADPGGYDGDMRHAACLVWRAFVLTQIALERSGAPKARGAK